MADGYRLGLLKWGDGSDTLSYWDTMHGNDVHIVLTDNGAFERVWTEGDDGELHASVTLIPDLTQRLRELLRRLENEE